jgi:hypothetical protein
MDEFLIAMDLDNLTGINHTARVQKPSEEKAFVQHVRQSSSNPKRIHIIRCMSEGIITSPLEEA